MKQLMGYTSNNFLIVVLLLLISGVVALIYLKEILNYIKKLRFIPEKLIVFLDNFMVPFQEIKNFKNIVLLVMYSIVIWGSLYLSVVSVLFDMGEIKFQCAFVLLIFLYLSLLIPSSPGAIGIIQMAFWFVLVNYGLSKEQAISYSIIYQGIYYLFTMVAGFPFFLKSNILIKQGI